jgi:hypothetical protein
MLGNKEKTRGLQNNCYTIHDTALCEDLDSPLPPFFVWLLCAIAIRKGLGVWVGHILRRNCLLKEVLEGKIKGRVEVTRRRGRRCKKLLDDLGDRRG